MGIENTAATSMLENLSKAVAIAQKATACQDVNTMPEENAWNGSMSFLQGIAGAFPDTEFERPPQGEHPVRDSW